MSQASPRVFAIVGPSGAGKDTLIAGALAARPDLRAVRRVITRPETAGGEDFEGVSAQEFVRRVNAGAFALHWQAHGLSYGIPAQALTEGVVLFNGSRAALAQAAVQFPELVVIVVTAPPEILAQRLVARGRERDSDIAARLARADQDLPQGLTWREVVNDSTPEIGISRLLQALFPDRA
jgi:ribose 1,5-bisphosphokinase